ncbi:MAG: porin family protein [Candidatus Omnitrophica bacterium]|nr:porin family protein [Candidatus Omnitrophota bacterium]
MDLAAEFRDCSPRGLSLSLIVGLALLLAPHAWAIPRAARWELRAGYGYQYTVRQRPNNYQLHPIMWSTVIPLSGAMGPAWLRGRWAWNPELWGAFFSHPYVRPLIGVTPLQVQYRLNPIGRWTPYGLLGAGILYANINREETMADVNFNIQGALGIQYALSDRTAVLVEYRHLHISNAGLHEENSGLNTHTFLAGVSVKS